jgi:hypothetical protein
MDNIDVFLEAGKKLNIPKEVFSNLWNDDDWSFIIKSHSIVEASLANKLSETIQNPQLNKHIYKLNINGSTGKLSIAKEFGIISKDTEKFIKALSSIRNDFVHSIDSLNKTISQYLNGMNQEHKKNFINDIFLCHKINFNISNYLDYYDDKISKEENFLKNPKLFIYISMNMLVTALLIVNNL